MFLPKNKLNSSRQFNNLEITPMRCSMIYLPENNRCGKEHTAKNTTDISPPWHHLWAKINYVTSRDFVIEIRKTRKYTWPGTKIFVTIVLFARAFEIIFLSFAILSHVTRVQCFRRRKWEQSTWPWTQLADRRAISVNLRLFFPFE